MNPRVVVDRRLSGGFRTPRSFRCRAVARLRPVAPVRVAKRPSEESLGGAAGADARAGAALVVDFARFKVLESALKAARSYSAFAEKVGMLSAFTEDDRFAPRFERRLLAFTKRFGPLTYVSQVITGRHLGFRSAKCVNLADLDWELRSIGLVSRLSGGGVTPGGGAELMEFMLERANRPFRESVVLPGIAANGEVVLRSRPDSLRCALWLHLFAVLQESDHRCRYCGEWFEPRESAGRPYRFCSLHRKPTYRKRADRSLSRDSVGPISVDRMKRTPTVT